MITIDLWGSKIIWDNSASFGINFLISLLAFSVSIVMLGSGLNSTLFFILSTIFLIRPLLLRKKSLSFVYSTILAPSKLASLILSEGKSFRIICIFVFYFSHNSIWAMKNYY